MALKYSDIITLSKSRTVYNIREEGPEDWKTFIANKQFNDLLDKTIKAVFNNDPDHHKSIWMMGTYGSGKSHAGAVIKHLLCDPLDSIMDYVDLEYKEPKYGMLRSNILSLRDMKRLFPVSLYGQQSITHEDDLSLQIQREIKGALEEAGININVKTDFDTYIEHINQQPQFWEMLINQHPKLYSKVQDLKKLKSDLANCDTGVLDVVNEALRENRYAVRMDSRNLCKWIVEVQNKLREGGVYDGLLIVWDEFTEICTSAIGVKLLERIQEIVDTLMSTEHDTYFLLISHPSALYGLNEEKRNQTIGRYNHVTYNMETVSAFKIMSRKFNIIDEGAHGRLVKEFYEGNENLLDIYSTASNQPDETKLDIQKLYPLHPGTADLATYYAREAGSSSRSVFEFLASDKVRAFFEDEFAYMNGATITADYLWDYVREAFNEDSARFGAVTEKYDNYYMKVEHQGENYSRVFKGVLLLNALNNIAHNDTVTPSVENISNLFCGTEVAADVEAVLEYFNEKSIIQRLPGGIFSIQFAALPGNEIEEIKKDLVSGQFKFTDQVAKFSDVALNEFNKAYANIARPYRFEIYSQQTNEFTLLNRIENGKKACKTYELFVAILVAKNFDELNFLKTKAHDWNIQGKLQDVTMVVFDATFENKNYDDFINLMANATCAQRHGLTSQQDTHMGNAKKMVKDWASRMRVSTCTYYINGEEDTVSGQKLVTTINGVVAPFIFSSGPESLQLIQSKFSKTYWKKQAARVAVDAVLQFNSKDEIIAKAGGQGKHVEYLLQDSVDSNLQWKSDIDDLHPLKLVCEFVDSVFKKTNKNQEFNLGEKLALLSAAPFGLYQSYAGMSMVAFAMRKYAKQIFDMSGKPRDSRNLVDDVCEMFKAWEEGKKSNKLNFMFESKESSELCQYFLHTFHLNNLPGYKDVSSLTDARWALLEYAKRNGYPLWALKFTGCKEELVTLVDNIVKICDPNGLANQEMIGQTAKLFKKLDLDLNLLLVEQDIFKRGFLNFLMQEEKVNLKEQEFDSVYDYLKKHLQGEIGRWSESEVRIQELYWRMEQKDGGNQDDQNNSGNQSGPANQGSSSNPSSQGGQDGNNVQSGDELLKKKEETLQLLSSLDDQKMRKAIERMIANENSYILDIIQKYVR